MQIYLAFFVVSYDGIANNIINSPSKHFKFME